MANTALDLVRSRAGTSTDDAVRGKDSKRRRPMLLVVASAAAALIAQHPSPLLHGKPPVERQRFVAAAQAAAPAADEPSDFMKFLEETRPREPPPSKEPPSEERADLGADGSIQSRKPKRVIVADNRETGHSPPLPQADGRRWLRLRLVHGGWWGPQAPRRRASR